MAGQVEEEHLTKNIGPLEDYDPTLDLSNYLMPEINLSMSTPRKTQPLPTKNLLAIKTRLLRPWPIIKFR
ncbi:MAG: hypothetical protein HC896_02375 [Bacteroidales bacterium]|nr:hypothetical protein [Bacteroidales bacterium]